MVLFLQPTTQSTPAVAIVVKVPEEIGPTNAHEQDALGPEPTYS